MVDYFKVLHRQQDNGDTQQLMVLGGLPIHTFPEVAYDGIRIPSALETLKCPKEMSLDKAPIPDGFTAHFVLKEWGLLR
jgi:hypothetical protein